MEPAPAPAVRARFGLRTERLGLGSLLERHVPTDRRHAVAHAQALLVLLRSILLEREPIYGQQETVHGFAAALFGLGSIS